MADASEAFMGDKYGVKNVKYIQDHTLLLCP